MTAALVPLLLGGVMVYGLIRGVDIYEAFAEGAAEALPVLLKIVPYLAGMLIALGVLRESGVIELLSRCIAPLCTAMGLEEELVPLLLLRPFSGSAAMAELNTLLETYGPDSQIGMRASTLMGSSETIFYEVALYFGAVQVKKTRFAVPVALAAMAVSVLVTLLIV